MPFAPTPPRAPTRPPAKHPVSGGTLPPGAGEWEAPEQPGDGATVQSYADDDGNVITDNDGLRTIIVEG